MGETPSFDELFPPVNEHETVKNVQHFLKRVLPRMIRTSGKSITALQSPSTDDMPKAAPVGNRVENTITKHAYAEQVVRRSIEAMNGCDHACQEILDLLYLRDYSDTMCYMSIGYGRTQYFDRWKPRALLQFADAYMLDDLHIYDRSN